MEASSDLMASCSSAPSLAAESAAKESATNESGGNHRHFVLPSVSSILTTHLIWFLQSLDLNAHHLAIIQSIYFLHCKQMHQ